MIGTALLVAAAVCAIVGLCTGRHHFYGAAILCLVAAPLLGRLL